MSLTINFAVPNEPDPHSLAEEISKSGGRALTFVSETIPGIVLVVPIAKKDNRQRSELFAWVQLANVSAFMSHQTMTPLDIAQKLIKGNWQMCDVDMRVRPK